MKTEIQICTRVRACKWRGTTDQMSKIKSKWLGGGMDLVCPQCGNKEFYIEKNPQREGAGDV